jgi:hypothetical protein
MRENVLTCPPFATSHAMVTRHISDSDRLFSQSASAKRAIFGIFVNSDTGRRDRYAIFHSTTHYVFYQNKKSTEYGHTWFTRYCSLNFVVIEQEMGEKFGTLVVTIFNRLFEIFWRYSHIL